MIYPWQVMDALWPHRDMRVEEWPLMGSILPTVAISAAFVYIVKVWGPNYMKDREPYNIRKFLVVYNFIQVIISTAIFVGALRGGWWFHFNFRCQPIEHDTERGAILASISWWYLVSKFTEFIDTFAFVARKKFGHVSVLHVIHHSIMPVITWPGVRFWPGGHGTFFGLCNTFVHIWMYLYYMVAAMGPQYSKYIWWKRHMTNMQIIQFIAVILHSSQLLFIECDFPWQFSAYILCYGFMFLGLFTHFYIQAYIKKSSHKKEDNINNNLAKSKTQ